MSCFPQIGAGSVAQFPVTRSRKWRSITNQLESSEVIQLPDAADGQIEWRLSYQDLTSVEVQNLSGFFAASQGEFGSFTFIDPMANLLAWSEKLSQSVWQTGLLTSTAGATDPLGTQRAWSVTNTSAGAQSLQQTIGVPGSYVSCFSAYLRSDVSGQVTLQRDSATVSVSVGPAWKRSFVSAPGAANASQSAYSLIIGPGQTVDVWGMQVEAQPYPSSYKQTSAALGIYEETYFGSDELKVTSTSVVLSSCDITLISRV